MSRLTPFERDFDDLHGRDFRPRAYRVHADVVSEAPRMRRSVRIGTGIGLAALSLFWILVFGALVLAGAVVLIAFIWALLTTPSPLY
jgi:hypothetical protein